MSGEYGTTIFCEDIRDEIGGKKTYVGVFGTDLIIKGALPAIIPQFALAITLLEPIPSATGPLNLKIYLPGAAGDEVAMDIDLPVERSTAKSDQDIDPTAEFVGALLSFKISPLVITNEGYIRVRAYKEGREIRLGSLKVKVEAVGKAPDNIENSG